MWRNCSIVNESHGRVLWLTRIINFYHRSSILIRVNICYPSCKMVQWSYHAQCFKAKISKMKWNFKKFWFHFLSKVHIDLKSKKYLPVRGTRKVLSPTDDSLHSVLVVRPLDQVWYKCSRPIYKSPSFLLG